MQEVTTIEQKHCHKFVYKLHAVDLIGGAECGVEAHVTLFKKAGIWEEDGTVKPEPGWLIVYNWDDNTQPNDGYSDHIGMVEKVSGNTIACIEGNMNGGVVGRRNIPVGYGYIRGYAKPKYATSSSSTNTDTATKKTVDELAKEVLSGLWGNGDDRKNNLTSAGYDYNAIQNKVNELVKGTTTTTKKVTTTTKKTTTTIKKASSGVINKTSQWKGVVTASALNVRTWAGTENGKCSFSPLYKGTFIDVCDTVKDKEGTNWYYIKYNNKYGFVSSLYAGLLVITIASGGTTKTINITVTESDVKVNAATNDLTLYLTSQGRSNQNPNRNEWVSETDEGTVSAIMTNFNFVSDGWVTDEDGITTLRVTGNARVEIPYTHRCVRLERFKYMANTRDTIGDQATVDGLVNHTLTSLEEDGIGIIGDYVLYNNNALTSVNFPNATSIGEYAIARCSALQTVLVPKLATSGAYAFADCKSLESISMPQLTMVSSDMFIGCSALSSVSIPNATQINQYAFHNCKNLTSIDLDGVTNIGNYAFTESSIGTLEITDATTLGIYLCQGCRTGTVDQHTTVNLGNNRFKDANSLCHLILRSTTMCTLTTSALTGTAIAAGIGWIYVPTDLVATYKSASNWSNYASQIVDISEYPKALQDETISDSWSTIFANEDNGTYKTVYSLGDIKYMYLNGTPMPMQIVAFDEDTSKISWVCKSVLYTQNMNPTVDTTGGWASSNMRAWLRETIYPMIDSTIRNRIVAVTKNYYDAKTSSRLAISDTVWIPSEYEVFGTTSCENSGTLYTGVFTDATSRIKKYGLNGSEILWWLRSANNTSGFRCVNGNGYTGNSNANSTSGVVLGFCT